MKWTKPPIMDIDEVHIRIDEARNLVPTIRDDEAALSKVIIGLSASLEGVVNIMNRMENPSPIQTSPKEVSAKGTAKAAEEQLDNNEGNVIPRQHLRKLHSIHKGTWPKNISQSDLFKIVQMVKESRYYL